MSDRQLIERLSRLCGWLALIIFAITGLMISFEVGISYVFVGSIRWLEGITSVLQICAVVFSCAWLVGWCVAKLMGLR